MFVTAFNIYLIALLILYQNEMGENYVDSGPNYYGATVQRTEFFMRFV